jgi:hypothetical protein
VALLAELRDRAQYWNATPADRERTYGCDAFLDGPLTRAIRAIDVDAPADLAFRWACQLKVAPYSYDWVDNLGRRSPRTLTPGADRLELGQHVMIGSIVAIDPGREYTVLTDGIGRALFGRVAMSYAVVPAGPDRSRLLCCLRVASGPLVRRLHAPFLLGDLVMMRKQFLVLKECAERDARTAEPTG